jgi:low temperature requirement protein LtrA
MSQPEKRVTWAELFFDLVFVFAVTQVSALLHGDHSWAGVGRALVVFVPVYWAWVGMSIHANTHDVDRPLDRIGIFTVGLGSLFMGLALPGAYGDRGVFFGATYWILRTVLAALVLRSARITGRVAATPFGVSVLITGPLLLVGGLLPGPARVAVWAGAALIDLATPAVFRSRLTHLRFDPGHLPERFGLFVLIALGESIVAIGGPAAATAHLDAQVVLAVAAAFVLACGLWWVYFHFASDAVRHAMATAEIQADILRRVLSYGHLAFISAIIAVAVGLAEVVVHPDHHLDGGVAGLLFGGCALYLATFGYTRWQMFRLWSKTRLVGAAVVLALLPAALVVPALVALGLLAAAVVLLNVWEFTLVRRAGSL